MSDTKQPEHRYSLDAVFSISALAGNQQAERLTIERTAVGVRPSGWRATLTRKAVGYSDPGGERIERDDAIESVYGETAEKAFASLVYKLRERATNDARREREDAERRQSELDAWDRQEWKGTPPT